ncbi:MAG: OmpH family outer membrane protein [Alistipes sp.]|nr:OmpH family outer membrane protein [Alistipes sp.]MBO7264241.1 OmpH family outer membrane protein [Alistipes sp.]
MKKFLKLTLAVALMVSATAVNAQKFGRVDLAAIVTNMTEYKEATTNLETYGRDLQDQLEQIQVEFNKLYAEYEKNVATYSDTVRQLKERELTELQQRFQDFQQLAQQDMAKKEAELMTPIYDKANEAVKQVSSAGGYIAIFSTTSDQPASAGLAYFDPAQLTDITSEVKAALGI